jgi:hypothetical protein
MVSQFKFEIKQYIIENFLIRLQIKNKPFDCL